ncbi:hypothetical protein OROGR_000808 [Orobanche gracilis]
MSSQEILKIRDGTPWEKNRVTRILVFKSKPSQEILKIRDGTPWEAEEILTYIKKPSKQIDCHFSTKFDLPSNVVQDKRVARILFFKRSSQEILKIRDGTPLEKKRVARILFFKIRSSQEILKIRDGTPLEAEEILTYIKNPRNGSIYHFSTKFDVPTNIVQNKRVARILFFKIRSSQEILKICDGTHLEKKRVARILFFKIRSSQEILKVRDGTPLEAEEILTYIKKPSKRIDLSLLYQKNRVTRILVFKSKPSQEILKIRDGTPWEAEEILTYIKKPSKQIDCHFSTKFDLPSNVVQNKRVARVLFFKIRSSQEFLKIRDGTPLDAEEILTYIKKALETDRFVTFLFDLTSNVLPKKRVARILFFKIRSSQEILKIRDGTPLEAEEILTYIKKPSKQIDCHFSTKFDLPSNVVQDKRVARILFFKIRSSQEILKIRDGTPLEKNRVTRILVFKSKPSQEILKIRDGTPWEAEEILTYIKKPSKQIDCHFSTKLDLPSNVVQNKRVARILFFKIRSSQEFLKIRDGTPLEAEEILTYIKKKRVARILFFKIRSSQEILKIRDGTPLEAEEILTYIKKPSKQIDCHFSTKFDLPSNVVQDKRVARILFFKIRSSQEILKIRDGTPLEFDLPSNVVQDKRVARILFFKIRSSQEILKIRDGTPLEAEEILTYIKNPRNGSIYHFSTKFDVPTNIVQNKRVARILFFKIRSSQEILKICDGTHLEKKRVARILFFKIRSSQEILKVRDGTPLEKNRVTRILVFKSKPSQEILKIRDGTPWEAEEILTYIKKPSKQIDCHFSTKFDLPSNVVQNKRVARVLFFKIRSSQEFLKIRDGTPLDAEEILTYIKKALETDRFVTFLKKRVARILFFKIRSSQEILKIRDGTPLEAEEILTYIKKPSKQIDCHFSTKFDLPSNVVQDKRVARILFFKIRSSQEILKIRDGTPLEKNRVTRILVFKSKPSQEILKIRDGTPWEAEEILTYIKKPSKQIDCHFSTKLDLPSNVVQNKRVARILFFKIRSSQEFLKIRDGTPLEKKRVARILFFKIRSSQEILKIRDGTPLEAEEILTYIKKPSKQIDCHFSTKFDLPSNVVQDKRVARILFFKIRSSQEILKIRDGTPLEKKRVARILFFKIRSSQEILKIRDGTPLEAEEILTYIKKPSKQIDCHFSTKFDLPSNVVQDKRVARILFFKIRSSQEILKIRDGTPLEKNRVTRILVFKSKPSQEILKIRDGTPWEAEEILTYIKKPSKQIDCHFSTKLDLPSNVVQNKRVARILFFKIRSSQEFLKIRDGTPLEEKRVARILNVLQKNRVTRILVFKSKPSQEILKIRDGTPWEAEEILTYIKKPSKQIDCHFSTKFDLSSNVVHNKRVARILFFKIRSSQEFLKIRDGTPLEKKRVTRILFFKIRSSQEILKIRDGTPLEAEEILTYIKNPRNGSIYHFSTKFDVPTNIVQNKRVARILFFKIRSSQEILKICDGTPLEKKRVARILFFKIRSSQEILKIRDGTPLEAEEILTYIKKPSKQIDCHFSTKFDLPSNVVQDKRVARILFFKIRSSQEILKIRDGTPLEKNRVTRILVFKSKPSQEILKIRDGTPWEAQEILTYIKKPSKQIDCHFSTKLDLPSNVVQNKRVARILFFKIRSSQEFLKIRDGTPLEKNRVTRILVFKSKPSQEILKIRDGTPWEAEEILTYIKKPSKQIDCHFSTKLDLPSNVLQKNRVTRILVFKSKPSQEILKIRDVKNRVTRILVFKSKPSQEILKIRDGTPWEAEEILTYIKKPSKQIDCHFSTKFDLPSNVVQNKRVARILFFKIRSSQEILKICDGTPLEKNRVTRILVFKSKPSQEILKIRDGTPWEVEEILTYIKNPSKQIDCHFSTKFDLPSNVVQNKRVARILFFKIRSSQEFLKIRDGTPLETNRVTRILVFKSKPSQEILKIRDGTPWEAEEILTYIKKPSKQIDCHFSTKFDLPSNVVHNKRVARILFFKIRSSQEFLKIRDGTPLEAEEILTYIKTNRVTRILVFKSKPSQEILKIRDGTPWEAEEILTYIKKPSKQIDCHFSTKFDLPSNVVHNKRVARILFFKIRSSQEFLKIRDGTPLEKNRVTRILVFKSKPSQEILKIRDGTPWEAEEILTYIKKPSKQIDCHFSTKFDLPSNVVHNKRVAQILFFKIRSSQEFLKIRDGTPLEAEEILTYINNVLQKNRVTRILVFKSKPSQEILKIRDGTPWEAEEILTYIKKPSKQIDCHFSTKFDLPSNVVQDKRVARILFFKIRSSQEILKIRDGTPLEKNRVTRILVFKSKPSQEILKIRDGTPWEAEEILTYIKKPSKQIDCHFSTKFDLPSNVVHNKRVARILFFKIRSSQEFLKIRDGTPLEKNRVTRILVFKSKPSQEILKIRDGTPWEAEEILTYIKKLSKQIDCHFSTKFDLPSNVVQDKRVARILFFKIRSSQEILKIRDGTPLEKKRVARILFFKIRSSQEILKIRDGTPLEAEEILTYIKNPRNGSIYHFSTKFDVPTNIVQNKRVARILFFKIRSSQEILKICDGTPLEKKRVARILFFKIRSSQEILKVRDGTPLEAEEILTYIKKPSKRSIYHFSTKFDVPTNIVQNKRVARILFFKIRSSQEILKICDGTPLEKNRVTRILVFKSKPSQEILKIRDGTPWEAEEILTYIKKPSKQIDCHFSTKFDLPSNVVQNKRVARILFFKIRSSQEILKICDGTPLELDLPSNVLQKNRVTRILVFKSKPSQEILKIRDGTPWEAEEILTYIKKPSKQIDCHFSTKFDLPSNVVQNKRVARILFFKIRSSQEILKICDGTPLEKNRVTRILVFKSKPSQEILKIRDGTPWEVEEILTYIKNPSKQIDCHFSTKFDLPSNVVQNKRVARILFFKIRSSQEFLKIRDGTPLEKKRVARILFFKIRSSQEILKICDGTPLETNRVTRILVFKSKPSQEILKIRDGTPWEAEEILTYIKKPSKQIDCHFSTKFDLPSNVVHNKRVARILFFKIRSSQEFLKIRDGTPLEAEEILTYIKTNRVTRILVFKSKPSQEILKIRDGTPWEAEEILTYIKKPSKQIDCHFSTKFDLPSNVVHNKRVARILFFKIRSSQEFLKIRDGTPLEAEEILTYIKTNRVTRILVFKSKPSQEILKIRDGTPWEAEEILTYIKKPSKQIDCHFSTKFDLPSNVVHNKRVARILFFKIRSSQEFLKIRDGTPLEAEEILTYINNVLQKNRVTRILVFKSKPSQEILKIRDGTPWEAEEILTYIKKPSKQIDCHFSTKFDLPSNVVHNKRVAQILFFKIRSSQEFLKIRDGTPLEAEEILTYINKFDLPSNVLQKNRVTRILVFKSKPSQEILKIRDGTPWEAEEILTYIKKPSKQIDCHFSTKFDLPSNVVQDKRVARILFFKIRSSQEILKIRDGTPLEKKRVARILFFKIRSSQEILKIRDGTPLEAEEILTYIKNPRNGSIYHFSTKFDVPTNIVQNKRVARILFFKIRSSQEILKICDGTHLEKKRVARILFFKIRSSQEILKVRDGTPLEKNRVTRILVFKSKPSQEILKIRDGTPWEAEEILTYIKKPSKQIDCHFSTKFDLPSNVVQNKRVARILFFKIRSSQEFLKIRDGTPLEAEEILTYIKKALETDRFVTFLVSSISLIMYYRRKEWRGFCFSKLVARILFFKIRSSQEILKIRDGTPLEFDLPSNVLQKNRVTRILVFKSKPSQEILKIRDGTPWEAEEILTYIKKPSKQIDCHFSTKFDLPSNVVQNKRVARILFFKIRSSQEFLKIRDGTPLEAEEILTYIKKALETDRFVTFLVSSISLIMYYRRKECNVLQKKRVARILFFKIRSSQEILKIRDGTPLEAEEILTYIKKPSKQIDCHFSTKFDLPSNVVQDKRVARILFFKIRSSQEILKIRDGTPLECNVLQKKRVARILFFKISSSQEILKIRDGTPLEAEEILTYIKKPSKQIDCHFSTKFDLPSNVVQDKRVARILFFKIRSSQEILKIRDGTPLEKKRVARILFFKIRSSQEILKIRDGTPLEAEEILTYIKKPSKQIDCHFSTKFDLPSNVVQDKRVARILFFKIRSSQEILKIRDGTPLEKKRVARILFFKIRSSQEILKVRDGTPLEFDLPSNVLQKNRVTRILVFKSKPSQEILKIRDGTPWEAEEILTYIKKPSKQIDCHFSTKFDLPSNVVQNKRVARILFFKIRSSQEFLKIRDGTPLEAEEILTYIKKALETDRFVTFLVSSISLIMYYRRKEWRGFCFSKLDNVLQKNRVTRILVFKSKPSQEILKIRDGTPWEAEEILTYIKKPSKQIDCHFSTKFDLPSNVVQNKRVARILFFKIRSSQEFLKIRDGTPLEAEEILTYIKKALETDRFVTFLVSSISLIMYYRRKECNVLQKKRVARILFFKIRSSQEILKIRDGTPLEAEEILTYIKKPSKQIDCHFSTKFDLPSNVVQDKRVARILFFKIRSSQEILKIRDGTPLEKKRVARILFFKIRSSQEILKIRDDKFDLTSNVLQKKRVARILFFKISSSQEILKIRDGTPLEAEEILTYIKKPSKQIDCHFSTKFDLPSNVVQDKRVARILFFKIRSSQEILKIRDGTPLEKKRVARILFFKIRSSQEILKIRDGTPLEAEEILTYIKKPSKQIDCHFSTKYDLPSNVVQDKRVARILFFKIRSSQEILKIRDGTPLEFDLPSNVLQKNRVTRILVFKSKPSQEILKIRDGTPWEAEEILTYIKKPSKQIDCHFSTKLDLPSNVVQNKRVARILFFKIRSSQEFLKIRDGTPLEAEEILTYIKKPSKRIDFNVLQKKRVARILFFKIRSSQEILKIRDGTSLEAEEILTYIKKPSKQIDCHFSTKFDLPSNVVQDKRVARILFFKIRSSQEILKIRDGTPLEKNRVTRILVFKSKPSQEILKIRDGTPWEAEEILTYIKKPSKQIDCHFSTKLDLPSNVVQNKRVARILFFKIRSSQEFLKIRDGTPLEAEEILTYIKKPSKQIDCHFSTKFDLPSNVVQDKRVARILFFKIRSSQEFLKIRDGTPLEAEEILTYIKKPSKRIDFNVLQKKRVARILFFKIRSSQEILKIRDGTPLEAEEILTYIKKPSKQIDCHFSTKFDLPSNVVQDKRAARILFFKIRSSQEILKIRDGTPLEKNRVTRIVVFKSKPSQEILKIRDGTPWEAEEILTYIKKPSKQIDCHFSTKLDLPSNVVQNKRVARILFFKIRSSQEFLKIRDGTPLEKNRVTRILVFKSKPSQEILKIRDGTPWEAEEILTYIKKPSKQIDCHFSTKFDLPSNVVQNKRVARILFFKIRSSQEFLKIRDGTPLEAEEILTYIKKALETDRFVTFLKNRVTRILVFKSKPSQEILKIRDGTPWEAEEILTYIKKPSKQIDCHFSTKFDLPSNVVQNKRVARILFFKIRSSQEFLKIRDGTPLEAEEILTYIKKALETDRFVTFLVIARNSKNSVKNRVTRILVFKSKPSQEILKIRDGTPWEAEEILTYIKKPSKQIDCHFSTKFDLPSNVVQDKRVARILFFKIRSSQEILKIRDGTPLEKKRVARILFFKIRSSQEILKICDGTPLEAEEILTYIKNPRNGSIYHFSTKFDVPTNIVQNKRVARILFFKIRSSQEILKICDGTHLEKKRVARILFFKIRSSQEILKVRDGTPLEAEEILTYIKKPSKRIDLSLLYQKNRVTRILVFKSKPSQEILKIRDGTPWEAEEILTYIKKPSKQIDCHFSTKFDLPSNVVQNKRVARILFFKIRSSQEFLKIRDGTPLEAEEILTYIKKALETDRFVTFLCNVLQKNRVTRILVFKSKPSQEILKIRDGTPWEAEEILTYIKKPSKQIDCHFSTKFDLPSNVVQNKRVARILFFKIRSSQEFLKIRDGTPLEAEEILTYIKKTLETDRFVTFLKKRVARILFFKIRSSQEFLKIRDGTPLEAEEILTYIKKPSKQIDCHFSTKFDLPINVVQDKRVARILFFKIRSSQEILKIRDGTPLETNRVTRILVFKSKPSQEILKIRDGTPWEAEEILTYIKKPSKQIDCHFSTKLDLPSNVVHNKRVARILFFKIRSSQEFLKIRDGTPLEKNRVTRILVFKSKSSQEILKIRDGTPWEAEEILTYIKKPSKQIDCHFSTKFDLPSNVVHNKRVAQILFFKIRSSQEFLKIRDGTPLEKNRVTRILVFKSKPSQEILKIRDGTPWEAEEILTYIKKPSKQIDCHFSNKFDLPSNVVQDKRVARILFFKIRSSQEILKIRDGTPLEKKRVARILFFKIRSSQEILKIRDGTPLEAEEILTYIKNPRNGSIYHFSTKFDVPTNIVQNKRVARILFFKIRSSQEILKICDGTHLEKKRVARILFFKIRSSQEILKVRDGTPLEKNRVTRILVFKSKPSQEILKIRDGTPWEAEEILTYIKKPSKQIDCHFSTKFDLPSNVVQNKRVARILFFKIRSSQEFLKIRDGTPLEAEEILTYIKKALETDRFVTFLKKRVARILFFKIRSSQEILKIRDGTPLEAEEILTYIKKPSKQIDCHFSTKFDLPSNVVQDKRVARILFFKIRSSQEILKIRDGTPLEQ